jgi:hypothetical protein
MRTTVNSIIAALCLTAALCLAAPLGAAAQARLIVAPGDTLKSLGDTLCVAAATRQGAAAPSTTDDLLPADSTAAARLTALNDSLMSANSRRARRRRDLQHFIPDPTRALWLSLVLPGAGQIYNRKYWKLPIFYGGFLGCTYALMWNQQMYRDYSQAYLDIMDDDPNTTSYLEMLPPRYDITGREDQFKSLFKRKKNYYRRYRDMSAFCFVAVYLLSVVDAYVDAQLSVFDISPDLSLRLEPAVIGHDGYVGTQRSAYGLGCSLHF